MTPLAHLSGAYIVYVSTTKDIHLENNLLFCVALAGSFAPDIDGLFGNKMKDHRDTVFHSPLFWLSLLVVVFILSNVFNLNINRHTSIFFLNILTHLFLDWFSARTSGIILLYPFSKKNYALFPLSPERGEIPTLPDKNTFKQWARFWKFYFSKKFLVFAELIIIISPALIYFTFK